MRTFNFISIIFSVFFIFVLPACRTLPPTQSTTPRVADSWETQQKMLSPLVYWAISGKLGIKTQQESHSTLLNWNQQDDQYHIYVTTPIGTSIAQINNDGHSVELVLSKTEKYQSDSLDELLWKQLGWSLPADHLFYWVRGLPAPTEIESYQIDTQFHLIQLSQSGWSINYTDYMDINGYTLPKKIVLTNPELKLTLLISQWRISNTTLPPS